MGIWIRTQDKRILIKCEDIQISGTDIVNFTRYGVVELGIYSTKEKALKVLDEIEQALTRTINVENIELSKLEMLKEELKQKRYYICYAIRKLYYICYAIRKFRCIPNAI